MAEIEMPPMDMQVGGTIDVSEALNLEASRRMSARAGFVHQAVEDFVRDSEGHIHTHIDAYKLAAAVLHFGPVVDGFISGMGLAFFPEAEISKEVFTTAVKAVTENLGHAVEEHRDHSLTGAKEQLGDAVKALSAAVGERWMAYNDHVMPLIAGTVRGALAQVPEPGHDHEWVQAMCDWMGFVEPSEANTYDPVRQGLEHEFVGVLASVQAEVANASGVYGQDQSPNEWSHDAREDEQRRYDHAHEPADRREAWDDSYKME